MKSIKEMNRGVDNYTYSMTKLAIFTLIVVMAMLMICVIIGSV